MSSSGRRPQRRSHPGQHAVHVLPPRPQLPDQARRGADGHLPLRTDAGAAGQCGLLGGQRDRRCVEDGARAADGPCRQRDLRLLPYPQRSHRSVAGRLRHHRRPAHHGKWPADRRFGQRFRARLFPAPRGWASSCTTIRNIPPASRARSMPIRAAKTARMSRPRLSRRPTSLSPDSGFRMRALLKAMVEDTDYFNAPAPETGSAPDQARGAVKTGDSHED